MIAFCIYCRDAAEKNGHSIVEPSDVYEAEIAYSRHVYEELRDEMHKQVPEYEDLFRAVNRIGYSRFTFADWQKSIKDVGLDSEKCKQYLLTLFEYAVVGVPRVGGKGGGSKYEFIYENRFLEPNFVDDLVVHPALRRHLNLKDAMPAADGVAEDEGDD